jgi:hypothetical protein
MFTFPRTIKHLAAGLAVASVAGAGLAGPALADGGGTTPFIQHWSAFSGGQVGGYTAGDVIDLHYMDPSGQTTERQYCWSPAPIGQPACGASNVGAPAQAGTQTVTAQLNNGQTVTTQFAVGPANTVLGTGTGAFTPPVLYTANGSITLSGDATLDTAIGQISAGQQVAGYYSPRQGVTQVYDYATNQSGFLPSALLDASTSPATPVSPVRTYTKIVRLKSDRTATYSLRLPAGFTPGNVNPTATAVHYSLYRGSAIGTGTGELIKPTGRGNHSTFLNATVVSSTYTSKAVTVTIKTGKLSGPLTLRIAANGTVS